MKAKKLFSAALITVSLMTGCASNPMTAVYDNDIKIASDSNTYSLTNIKQTTTNGHFTASVDKMEGMDTIWFLDSEKDTSLDITYTLNVSSGKMKLVFISPKGEVFIIAECDSEMAEPVQTTLDIRNGNNRIKIVAAENTKFDIDISVSEGEFQQLG